MISKDYKNHIIFKIFTSQFTYVKKTLNQRGQCDR